MSYKIILFLLCCISSVHAADVLYLTWQNDPTTTMTIQWLSDLKSESDEIELKKQNEKPGEKEDQKEDKAQEWKKIQGSHKVLPYNAPHLVHTVEVTGLAPDSLYSFRLPGETAVNQFRTMPSDLTKPVQFAAGGDAYHGDGDYFDDMTKKVASMNPRFVLLGGDIAYSVSDKRRGNDKIDRWLPFLRSWTKYMKAPDGCIIPIVPAIGNHEVVGYYDQTPEQAKFFYAFFACPGPQGYKQLLFGKYMSICLLDSNHTHPIGGEQTTWLQDALRRSYSCTHRFALYHVPAYPSVRQYGMKESAAIRRHWVPLFERYSMHGVFENHEHAYKRTHPLIDGSEHPDGVVYFGDGSWGVKPRKPKSPWRTTYLAKSKSCRQFIMVELTNETRSYKAISTEGEVIDTYTQKVQPPEKF